MTITSLKSALQRIAQLERENEQLRAELKVYKPQYRREKKNMTKHGCTLTGILL